MNNLILYGLSNEAYHHEAPYSEYLSSSQLKQYLKSPRHAKFTFDNPAEEDTDALRLGSMFHDLMSSCAEHFDNGPEAITQWLDGIAVFDPPVNEKTGQPYEVTTKAFTECIQRVSGIKQGQDNSLESEIRQILQMNQSLLVGSGATSKQVCKLLKYGKPEVSYFYETEVGIKLKVRPDLLTRDKIVDWKTCSLDSLDQDSIARQIIKYRYDVSLAMYQRILHEIEGKWYTPILVFVQKQPPFGCIMCDISDWCYSYDKDEDFVKPGVGALEFRRLLNLHTKCVRDNHWPSSVEDVEE